MGNQRIIQFIWLLFHFLSFSSSIHSFNENLDELLDSILHDHAFKVMIHQRPHTGALYNASLPANLAGIRVSILGLRSTTLWRKGANFSNFIIPPKTLPVPYVKRLAIVYHNLGNRSSLYYNLSGYSLESPVVGFLVYNASRLGGNYNLSKIELNTMGNPISIQFKNRGKQRNRGRKCATFGAKGGVYVSEMSVPDVCYSTSEGHFSIVVPLKKRKMWAFLVIGFVAGFTGLMLVVLGGTMAVRSFFGKRSEEMEREADEGEGLQTYWIASSKLPRAEVMRTQPVLESTTLPNPKLSWYA